MVAALGSCGWHRSAKAACKSGLAQFRSHGALQAGCDHPPVGAGYGYAAAAGCRDIGWCDSDNGPFSRPCSGMAGWPHSAEWFIFLEHQSCVRQSVLGDERFVKV